MGSCREGPLMMMKDSLSSADFKCFRKRVWGHAGRGPLMMMKDSLSSADFKCFRKRVWGHAGRGPTNDDEGFSVFCRFQMF